MFLKNYQNLLKIVFFRQGIFGKVRGRKICLCQPVDYVRFYRFIVICEETGKLQYYDKEMEHNAVKKDTLVFDVL